MPWNNSGDHGEGPWGAGPQRSPQQKGPDLDAMLRGIRNQFSGRGPSGKQISRAGIAFAVLIVLVLWLLSGFYRVDTDELGLVTRFGEYNRKAAPGLNYHLPYPVEDVIIPKVTRLNRIDVGVELSIIQDVSTPTRDIKEESLMLTGDENIVDVDFTVFWIIDEAEKYVFNIRAPDETIKAVAESAMREEIGRLPIQFILTQGRQSVELSVQQAMQKVLDRYGAGVRITQVNLQRVDPPAEVVGNFRDVQKARADQEKYKNEAEAYANDVVPKARGDAQQIVQRAEAEAERIVAEAQGEAERFIAVYNAYLQAPEVVKERLYQETIGKVISASPKKIVDIGGGGQGALPVYHLNSAPGAQNMGN